MGIGGCCCSKQKLTKSIILIDNNPDDNGNEINNGDIVNNIISNNQKNSVKIIKNSYFGIPDILQPPGLINQSQERYSNTDEDQYINMCKKLENSHQDTDLN